MARMARSGWRDSAGRLSGFYKIWQYHSVFTDRRRRVCKRGWRIAVSMIYGYTKDREKAWEIIDKLGLCSEQESKVQFAMADRKINAVMSTSAGRLFDAVSAILGIRLQSSFEGEASTALQFAAEAFEQKQISDLSERHNIRQELIFESEGRCILNTETLVQQIVAAKLQGVDSGALAYLFHQTLAEQIVAVCIGSPKKFRQK